MAVGAGLLWLGWNGFNGGDPYFAGADAAEQARKYWQRMVDRYVHHPLVALIGMREPLAGLVFEIQAERVLAHTTVSEQQARVLLGFIHSAFARPRDVPHAGATPDPRSQSDRLLDPGSPVLSRPDP